MTVSYLGSAKVTRTDTSDPYAPSFTSNATKGKGTAIFAAHGTSSTDHITSMTLDGNAMTRVATSDVNGAEPGRVDGWFIGTYSPESSATANLSVDLASGTGDDITFLILQLNGTADLRVIDSDTVTGTAITNPSVTLQTSGYTCISLGAAYSSQDAFTTFQPGSGLSSTQSNDFGAFTARAERQTTVGSSDFTFGYTADSADYALVAFCVTDAPIPTLTALVPRALRPGIRVSQPTEVIQL